MMKHKDASELLPRLLDDELSPAERRRVEEHVGGCERCREWLATYRLVVEAASDAAGTAAEPSSERLAVLAAAPETMPEEEQRRIERHLDACPACRSELEVAREALARAREPAGRLLPGRWGPALRQATRPLLAAALAVAVLGAVFFVFRPGAPERGDRFLEGLDLDGSHLVEAEHAILAERMSLRSGADVVFRAGESVAFGGGFVIADGATLTVEITGPGTGPADSDTGER